ncbi:MAG: polyprenyl synthetase family protein [Oscillospiraceae bacterium]|nr:polyprenyl synthetase family protein [Oscillospiraceae bacterium]
MEQFIKQMNRYRNMIEAELDNHCFIPDEFDGKVINEAMAYSLSAGGKRIRPILTLAVCDMLGGDVEAALPFATAIEMIHTYSLIHDDLPCMDNDDMRRGKPTCHKVFGEAIAVLAGDALLTEAFGIMASCDNVPAKDIVEIIYFMSSAIGPMGMIGGQVLDMKYEGGDGSVTQEDLENMVDLKTGCLIKESARIGAIIAGADCESEEIDKIIIFAQQLGLAFQIKDDILDLIGDAESLGKNVGMDIERGKATFVTVLGLDGAAEMLEKLTAEAIDYVSYFGDKAEFLIELTKYLLEREN